MLCFCLFEKGVMNLNRATGYGKDSFTFNWSHYCGRERCFYFTEYSVIFL